MGRALRPRGWPSFVIAAATAAAVASPASCNDATVVSCGRGRRVSADGHAYCAFDDTQVAAGQADCPDGLPHRIEVGAALVCADRPLAPEDVPSAVCEAVSGCDAAPIDAGDPRDGGSRDASADAMGRDARAHDEDAGDEDASSGDAAAPTDAGAPTGRVVEISGGDYHSCARRDTGRVACWGSNAFRELGLPEGADHPFFDGSVVPDLPEAAIDIDASRHHTCAAMRTGEVWCWGSNAGGRSDPASAAGEVGASRVAGVVDAVQVAVDMEESCALRSDGSVWCWGDTLPGSGEPADASPIAIEGVTGAVQIAAGNGHVCARLRTGRVLCWGVNYRGELGVGMDIDTSMTPLEVVGITAAEDISAGSAHTCAVVAGDVWCWGDNSEGQLGRAPARAGGDHLLEPIRVESITDVLEIAAGGADGTGGHTCARRALDVACWGGNLDGQTGHRSLTTPMPTPSRISLTLAHLGLGSRHSCGVDDGGRAFCWGSNSIGQLGFVVDDGDSTPVPQELMGIP